MRLKVGEYVKPNPEAWQPNEFDSWGRGIGVGQVVEPPFEMANDQVDIRWPGGRCFEKVNQLLPVEKDED